MRPQCSHIGKNCSVQTPAMQERRGNRWNPPRKADTLRAVIRGGQISCILCKKQGTAFRVQAPLNMFWWPPTAEPFANEYPTSALNLNLPSEARDWTRTSAQPDAPNPIAMCGYQIQRTCWALLNFSQKRVHAASSRCPLICCWAMVRLFPLTLHGSPQLERHAASTACA